MRTLPTTDWLPVEQKDTRPTCTLVHASEPQTTRDTAEKQRTERGSERRPGPQQRPPQRLTGGSRSRPVRYLLCAVSEQTGQPRKERALSTTAARTTKAYLGDEIMKDFPKRESYTPATQTRHCGIGGSRKNREYMLILSQPSTSAGLQSAAPAPPVFIPPSVHAQAPRVSLQLARTNHRHLRSRAMPRPVPRRDEGLRLHLWAM